MGCYRPVANVLVVPVFTRMSLVLYLKDTPAGDIQHGIIQA